MKKLFVMLICILGMLMPMTAFAQVSYEIMDVDSDIPGFTKIEGTSLYGFESDGRKYYTSKPTHSSLSIIRDYNEDEFNFFVGEKHNAGYKWTGKYYMYATNDIDFFQEEQIQYKYTDPHGTVFVYDENFNLIHEYDTHQYVYDFGYANGLFYYTPKRGETRISSDMVNWETGEKPSSEPKPYEWNGIFVRDGYEDDGSLSHTISFDGEKFYDIAFEKNCEVSHGVGSIDRGSRVRVSPYFIRDQRNHSDEENSWIGFSRNNIYYSYLDLNKIVPNFELGDYVCAHNIISIGDYLYIWVVVSRDKTKDVILKIPLSEIEAELDKYSSAPIVVYDNTILAFEQPPVIDEAWRTLIPLRFLFEKMGAEVSWDDSAKTATVSKDGQSISVTIDSRNVIINGKPDITDAPARLINGKTMVPLRLLSENLGYTVDWNEELRMATVK